jgi:hypothetical protein
VAAAPVRNTVEVEKTIAKLGREPGGGLIVAPERVHRCSSALVHQAGAAAPIAGRLLPSDIRRARRLDVVWT